jgi:solute carrier family 6 (neurotransmitter transporter, GABA) member 1
MDAIVIACSNSAYEMIAGFSAFGIAGFMKKDPANANLGTFTLGFEVWPAALADLPGAQIWSIIFFLTLFLLGIDSAFSNVEGLVTLIEDSHLIGRRGNRAMYVGAVSLFGILCSLIYSSDIGRQLMDSVDKYTSEFALPFFASVQCFACGYIYRYKDVIKEVGNAAYLISMCSYIYAIIVGVLYANIFPSGNYVGLVLAGLIFFGGIVVAVFISKAPTINPYKLSKPLNRLYFLTLYQIDSLRKDLNVHVSSNGRLEIPLIWGMVVKYITGPITLVLALFSLQGIEVVIAEPINLFGFLVGMLAVVFTVVGILIPPFFELFLPEGEKEICDKLAMIVEPGEIITSDFNIKEKIKPSDLKVDF